MRAGDELQRVFARHFIKQHPKTNGLWRLYTIIRSVLVPWRRHASLGFLDQFMPVIERDADHSDAMPMKLIDCGLVDFVCYGG